MPIADKWSDYGAPERVETIVVGGGQAGLSVGYHLARRGRPVVILDASERIGDSWRERWESLRLFSPARYCGLPGWRFPAPPWSFPMRDEMADYLEAYASRFELPVRSRVRVDRVWSDSEHYVVAVGERRLVADNVVLAPGPHQIPALPAFARELDPTITQLHSGEYRNPSQLREGGVLVVGAGNSGADIALELSAGHRVWLSGSHPGQVPFRIETRRARLPTRAVFFAFRDVLTVRTPLGRKVRQHVLAHHSGPLVRVKSSDLAAAGIERVPRTIGAHDGSPALEDGRVLDVSNVIWCTGFRDDLDWLDVPVFGADAQPVQDRGVVDSAPGLYFVGREFLYALASSMIQGVGSDADHIARHIASRESNGRPAVVPAPSDTR
jgi:putative flavoprotein involved in K+ transport